MNTTAWATVQEVLNDLDFPATKQEIVEHAEGRDEGAVKLLRALPLATYQNISDIRSSVRLDPAVDEDQAA